MKRKALRDKIMPQIRLKPFVISTAFSMAPYILRRPAGTITFYITLKEARCHKRQSHIHCSVNKRICVALGLEDFDSTSKLIKPGKD